MDFLSAFAAAKPLYEEALRTLPAPAASRVVAYAVTYRWMTDHLGREPSRLEHAEALDVSLATYKRYRRDFRRAFRVDTPLALPASMVPSLPTLSVALKLT